MTQRAPARRLLVALVGGIALSAALGAQLSQRTGLRVDGVDRVSARLPPEAQIADYDNAGYRLRRVGADRVEIETVLAPLDSSVRFDPPGDPDPDDLVAALASRVTAGAGDRYTAVSRVLSWVSRNIRYRLDRTADQSAVAVIDRRTAHCTGIARLTVAMLAAVEIEAREVPGFVVGRDDTVSGYHRWVEVLYPDRGWVFSDPLTSHHFVPATYVRLANEELRGPPSPAAEMLLGRSRQIGVADIHPLAPAKVLARGNRGRQRATTLRVELVPPGSGSIELEGNGVRVRNQIEEGRSAIVGLGAGLYDLRVELTGGTRIERVLGVGSSPARSVLTIRLPETPTPSTGTRTASPVALRR